MTNDIIVLSLTAASMGFLHTLFGPDHYLPFIVISKARQWSILKTLWTTLYCGIGHILSSVVLGFVGIAFGIAVTKLEFIESTRGEIAAWFLIAFGLIYCIWGIRRAVMNKPHVHTHAHEEGVEHVHTHTHADGHLHVHDNGTVNITPWVLFIIFVLGPCEPLIPILMYPAAKGSMMGVFAVTLVFGTVTVATMMMMVAVSYYGISLLPLKAIERYTHAIAGATISLSGLAIKFLGL